MKSKRTVQQIESEIAALKIERDNLKVQNFIDKYGDLIEILDQSILTVPQIKKAIKDAEAAKATKPPRRRRKKSEIVEQKARETQEVTMIETTASDLGVTEQSNDILEFTSR